MYKVMICDLDHKDAEQEAKVFAEAGYEFKWLKCKDQQEVIDNCKGAVVLLNQYIRMDKTIFRALPSVKCIVRYGVGYDNINLSDANEYGVVACNVPDYGIREVADHALAHMMALTRKTTLTNKLIRQGVWDYQREIPIFRLSNATVGICGVGRIGSAFVERVRPLCREVIAYDAEYGRAGRIFPDFVKFVSFDELLARADILSVHCPLSADTYHMFGKAELSRMKKTAYLINVSRGGIVDEAALFDALKGGVIAGAGLDVVEKEPMDEKNPLLTLDNFSVSPHTAWYSEESARELKTKAAQEAVRFLNGEAVHYQVNKRNDYMRGLCPHPQGA